MAYRTGWSGSRIAVCEVNPETGETEGNRVLALSHPRARIGSEDPRLFTWQGRLHVAYTAYDGRRTHQLYARLSDSFKVEQVFAPEYQHRAAWEKNWQFFEGTDKLLYAVYSVDPHIVLRINGDRTEAVGQTDSLIRWSGGVVRGGCPPVLIDGQFWHWTHGVKEDKEPNRRYSVGLYTFDPDPPFRVRHSVKEPVAWASEEDWRESGNYCRVVFPGGAVFDKGTWRVAVGVHDRWCEIWSWSHADARQVLGMNRTRGHCFSLGVRTEFRAGCNGWRCEHECDAGKPVAIPGEVCQTCEKWEPR